MTKEEIYSSILVEHAKEKPIAKIPASATSDTLGAIYRAVATGMKVFSEAVDDFKAWFELYRFTAVAPSRSWMGWKATQYQHGDTLVFSQGAMTYPTNDDSKKIVHVASVRVSAGQTYCSAAKLNKDTGILELLSVDETSGLESYMRQIVPADTYLIVSRPIAPDNLLLTANIYVDATKISTNGAASYDNNVFPIVDAINAFLATYTTLNNFGATLYLQELESAIRIVPGVKNVVISSAKAAIGENEHEFINTVTRSYDPEAGFMVFDSVNSTINYITA